MDITTYQKSTEKTAIYREGIKRSMENPALLELWCSVSYCTGKLNGESGEIAEEVFKALRDDDGFITQKRKEMLFKELGDVMWYVSQLCNELGFKLEDVMSHNLSKLQDRKDRGTLGGSGDLR